MRESKVLKPTKKGLRVINPATNLPLKEQGQLVVMSTYWARQIKCGDVVEVKKEEPKQETVSKSRKSNKNNNESEE